jgi:calcium/calmodulin-dependent protein kinase I
MGNSVKKLRSEDINKYYSIGEKLGTGSFAVVKQGVRLKDNFPVAIKIIKKAKLSQEELSVVHDEVEIMHKIQHKNCVNLYEMFETPKKIYMVLELLTGGELFDRIVAKGSYSELEAAIVMKSITQAIQHLHSIGIVHRDLKPENLIYLNSSKESPLKITDFGLAKFRSSKNSKNINESTITAMTTACGTPGYVAPEVLKNEAYTAAVDLCEISTRSISNLPSLSASTN